MIVSVLIHFIDLNSMALCVSNLVENEFFECALVYKLNENLAHEKAYLHFLVHYNMHAFTCSYLSPF